jgi:hypothetical protein
MSHRHRCGDALAHVAPVELAKVEQFVDTAAQRRLRGLHCREIREEAGVAPERPVLIEGRDG